MRIRLGQTLALLVIFLVAAAERRTALAEEDYCGFDCWYVECFPENCSGAMGRCSVEGLPWYCDGCDFADGRSCTSPCYPPSPPLEEGLVECIGVKWP